MYAHVASLYRAMSSDRIHWITAVVEDKTLSSYYYSLDDEAIDRNEMHRLVIDVIRV